MHSVSLCFPPCCRVAAQPLQFCRTPDSKRLYRWPPCALQRNLFKYAGQWEEGVQCGEGKCQYADGSQYDGQWKAGQR